MGPKFIIASTVAILTVASCSSDDEATPPATAEPAVSTEATDAPVETDPPAATDAPVETDPPAATDAPVETDPPAATDAPVETDPPVATDAPLPTDPPDAGGLAPTPLVGVFADAYDFQGGSPDPALLPAQLGEVEAHWYRAGDVLAVVYVGLDASVDACPGNSALVSGAFDFVSNAELPNGSCPDFPTRIESSATQGVQVCDGQVSYLTLIPADTVGQVFASIEKPVADVQGVGLASAVVLDDPSLLPEIDATRLAC